MTFLLKTLKEHFITCLLIRVKLSKKYLNPVHFKPLFTNWGRILTFFDPKPLCSKIERYKNSTKCLCDYVHNFTVIWWKEFVKKVIVCTLCPNSLVCFTVLYDQTPSYTKLHETLFSLKFSHKFTGSFKSSVFSSRDYNITNS